VITDDNGQGTDSDADNDTLSVSAFSINATNYSVPTGGSYTAAISNVGTVKIASNGAYTFTPVANYYGTVPTVTYTLSDGAGHIDTADLDITVNAVTDPISDGSETVSIDEDGSLSGQKSDRC